jgi:hypothetical protein
MVNLGQHAANFFETANKKKRGFSVFLLKQLMAAPAGRTSRTRGLRERSRKLIVHDGDMSKLRPREVEILRDYYAVLFRTWGYRTGRDGAHERYEDELHGLTAYGYLTPFTDPLFRNLQQIAAWGQDTVISADGYHLFWRAAGIDPGRIMNAAEIRAMHDLLGRFLAEPDPGYQGETMLNALTDMAGESLRGRTVAFATVVFAANAVLAVVDSDYGVADNIARLYMRRYDTLQPEVVPEEGEGEDDDEEWEDSNAELLYSVRWKSGAVRAICAGGRVWDATMKRWACEHTSSVSQLVNRAQSGDATHADILCHHCASAH